MAVDGLLKRGETRAIIGKKSPRSAIPKKIRGLVIIVAFWVNTYLRLWIRG